ncbi:hypothetical protein KI387_003332, partial [Taxus chinensis]
RKRGSPSSSWEMVWEAVIGYCTIHGSCGENAMYKVDQNWEPQCQCPPGFDPGSSNNKTCRQVNKIKGTDVRFVEQDYVNFDGLNVTDATVTKLQDCKDSCENNASCMGFVLKLDSTSVHCVYQYGKLQNGYWSPKV